MGVYRRTQTQRTKVLPVSWVFASQNDSVQPSGLLSWTQLYEPGSSPTWQSIPNATFESGYEAGFTATGIVGTDSLTVGQLPPVRQHVGVMWYDSPVMDGQQIQGILGLGLSSGNTSGSEHYYKCLACNCPYRRDHQELC